MNEKFNYLDAVFLVSVLTKKFLSLIHSAYIRLAVKHVRNMFSRFKVLSVLLVKYEDFRNMTLC